MTKRKFTQGRRILSTMEFERCASDWYILKRHTSHKTVHRSFLISWQYRYLHDVIERGELYIAEPREETKEHDR